MAQDLTQRLSAVLSDPESLQNLSELAAMLQSPPADDLPPEDAPAPPPQPGLDIAKLMLLGQAVQAAREDSAAALLEALRPHLSPARAKRTATAILLLRLCGAAGVLRESGALQELLGQEGGTA